jgi:glycerophosphoryl diester phosphodiesterase
MPSLAQLFDFVDFYAVYYRDGAGKGTADAEKRWHNAARVRFNIETKINPRSDKDPRGVVYKQRTVGVEQFVSAVAGLIAKRGLEARADVQSFDFRTLLRTQERYPKIRTVYLFGDFPAFADPSIAGSDDGTNLQPQGGSNTPWLAGLPWPYRVTVLQNAFRAQRSGGLEGMALSHDRKTLLPLMEKALSGDDPKSLLIEVFDLRTKQFTGARMRYPLNARGTSIGDFQMVDATHGVVIERDDSMGDLTGFKRIYEVTLGADGSTAVKRDAVDVQQIADPFGISPPGAAGDVGIGNPFAFPFTTIEDIAVLQRGVIAVMNDNNFPFSVGRHVGSKLPDDEEFIVLELARPLAVE